MTVTNYVREVTMFYLIARSADSDASYLVCVCVRFIAAMS